MTATEAIEFWVSTLVDELILFVPKAANLSRHCSYLAKFWAANVNTPLEW
jgi:hypothetical protein